MTYEIYSWEGSTIEYNLQIAKQALIHNLYEEGHINEETYEDYMLNYALILKRPSFWNKFWNKIIRFKEDNPIIVVVKQCSLREEDAEENSGSSDDKE